MGIVRASPSDLHLVFDPLEGMIAEERDDVIQFALDPIMAQMDEKHIAADDLVHSFDTRAWLLEILQGEGGEDTTVSR